MTLEDASGGAAVGLGNSARGGTAPSFDLLYDVSLPVVVELGRARSTVGEVLQLGVGSVVTLERKVGEPVDLYVSDRLLAHGELVVSGDRLAVRVTALATPERTEAGA